MKIIGHPLIKSKDIFFVDKIDESLKEKSVLFRYNHELIKKATELGLEFSIECFNTQQALIANAINAELIVCDENTALKFSELAEFYMFDSKIACVIQDENELEKLAKLKVDVAIFKEAIKNGNF
ncbi:hypothetical protein [Campylobacter pinnipediorum]|uniref:Uncharacterized protein n=1 Tax=Campylobacter pinnipediorum subsp. pinnipediorum TaxID=1660067 RepID=A0AAX0LAU6_9BACT|nr:hypothetical protein [Campylobacter pinnipediorum]AQW83453.1 hypothetical protein CPIN17261_1461 [Campylobacter pinnipediorum subsp. pinnipediorum]AQW84974.1 hypothetical protein CPIN17262_1306 [Campylobacter pinnipediorum subsp. pinnipediorum]OPA79825.1 hypothetical protein BFG05_01625 [Campylobacter pinnipediorum subsp. pinnipediorum]OPA81570.1 hypothetical protein BFG04_00015 [Campylobacter pinnipediorum subsp. pinnipediorum]